MTGMHGNGTWYCLTRFRIFSEYACTIPLFSTKFRLILTFICQYCIQLCLQTSTVRGWVGGGGRSEGHIIRERRRVTVLSSDLF